MANLFKRLVEGKEKSDDYARSTLPTNRFSLFWDVFKNNFFKLMGVNVFILIFFLPVIFLFLQRSNLVLLSAEKIPFSSNLVTGYPIVPIRPGQEEAINLLANRWFYFMMPIAAIIASIGLSGGLYIIRNLIWTEGVLVVSDLWRGIKKNFLQIMEIALIYSVVLLITMVGANYLTYLQAVGWSHAWLLSAARVMCYVALGIATLMTMHMLTMSVTYKLSIFKLLNNSFVFSYALIIPNLFFGAIALLPFILLLALPMSAFYGMWLILVVLLGFSFSFLVWMDYTQWAFDKFVNPRIEGARVNRGIYKGGESEQESAAFKQYREQKKETLKQLAEDHLVSNPIKPIDDDIVVEELPEHYTIKDLERLKAQKDKMIEDANAWAEEHKNDEKYAVFAELKKEASEQDEARRKKLETYKKKEQNATIKRNKKQAALPPVFPKGRIMENRTAYSALASCYDALMKEEDYAAQTAHLTALLKAHGAGKKGVDLGCGSGTFTLALAKAGYRMTGVDLSQEMLTVAQNRCAGYPVSFFLQDIASLRLPEKYDFMTAVTDGFNYVPQKKAATALKKMAAHLTQGGLLYLDLSSAYKLREVLGNNLFGEDDENLSYLWFNRLEEDRVEMDLSFFFREEDGKFVKREENHVQYVYEKDFLTQLLENAGFTVLSVTDKNGEPYTEASHRMQILARLN